MSSEQKDAVIIGDFNLTVPLPPNGAQLSIKGFVYNLDKPNDVHGRIDLMQDVAQRQVLRASLGLMESNRKAMLAHLGAFKARYADLAAQVQGGKKLKTQQQQEYQNGESSIKQVLKNIDEIDAQILEAKEKLKLE